MSALEKRPHLPYLDGVRCVLALYVVFHHAYLTLWPPGAAPSQYTNVPGAYVFHFGRLAVDAFIVVSGFCLMLPELSGRPMRRRVLHFYWKRARRILPPYYAALAGSLLLIRFADLNRLTGTHWDISIPVHLHDILLKFLLLNDSTYKINHVFWSVAVEWWIYFLFPLLVFIHRRVQPPIATGLVVAFTMSASFLARNSVLNDMHLHYIGLFSLGMLATNWDKVTNIKGTYAAIVCCLAFAFLIARALEPNAHFVTAPQCVDLLAGIIVAGALAVWFRRPGPIRSMLSWRPLVFVGTFSYSLYLVHAPLVQLSWQLFIESHPMSGVRAFFILLATSVPISLGAAYLFFIAFERPFMSSQQRRAVDAEQSEAVTSVVSAISPVPDP